MKLSIGLALAISLLVREDPGVGGSGAERADEGPRRDSSLDALAKLQEKIRRDTIVDNDNSVFSWLTKKMGAQPAASAGA